MISIFPYMKNCMTSFFGQQGLDVVFFADRNNSFQQIFSIPHGEHRILEFIFKKISDLFL